MARNLVCKDGEEENWRAIPFSKWQAGRLCHLRAFRNWRRKLPSLEFATLSRPTLSSRQVAEFDRRLRGHVRGKVANRQDAEDIAQESWARTVAVTQSDRSRISHLGAYLFRVARNLVIDHRRRQSASIEDAIDDAAWQAIADPRPNAEAQLVTRDELRRMDRVMAAMPARAREVFRLSRIEGLAFAEIARRLNISRQTVHEHMTRALLAIQLAADADFDA